MDVMVEVVTGIWGSCMPPNDAIGASTKRTSTFDPSFGNPEAVHPVKSQLEESGRYVAC